LEPAGIRRRDAGVDGCSLFEARKRREHTDVLVLGLKRVEETWSASNPGSGASARREEEEGY
jgi:hypothetical protein